MRTSLAGPSGPAGLASRLLLALALCACDERDDAGQSGGGAATRTADAPAALAAATDSCGAPPPAYPVPVLNGPWQTLLNSMNADGVTFPDTAGNSDTTSVKLCKTCVASRVVIRSGNRTPCLSAGDLNGSPPRITGMFIVLDPIPAQPGWKAFVPGDSIFLFANAASGPAMLVFREGTQGKMAPSNAWTFWFCPDNADNGTTARSQWRPRGTPPGTPPRTTPAPGDQDGGGGGGGTYGWLACASGCCQFYTPPPNESMQTTPPQADSNAPDLVGKGQNQGNGGGPYWCKT